MRAKHLCSGLLVLCGALRWPFGHEICTHANVQSPTFGCYVAIMSGEKPLNSTGCGQYQLATADFAFVMVALVVLLLYCDVCEPSGWPVQASAVMSAAARQCVCIADMLGV
jgi:hypothetical protein